MGTFHTSLGVPFPQSLGFSGLSFPYLPQRALVVASDELKRQLYHQERQRDASVGGQCLLLAWIVLLGIVNGHFSDHRHSELTQQNTFSSWTEAVLASSVSA